MRPRWVLALLALLAVSAMACSPEPEEPAATPVTVPAMEARHIPHGERFISYNSNPPTSGPHWPRWADCGVYPAPDGLPNELIVHNLEHGNVVISYNLVEQSQIDHLLHIVQGLREWGRWGVLRYYPGIEEGDVALSAWGVLDSMNGVNEARIQSFWEAHAPNRLSEETKAVGPIPCSQ